MQSNMVILHAGSSSLPSVFTARPEARSRLRDFFTSHIRNPNTRRAYMEAVRQFSAFCAEHGILDLAQVEPIHVAAFVESQLQLHSKTTVKQRLAALRMLFDWMVVGQILSVNPAHAVRGPKHSQKRGKTPVLQADEARTRSRLSSRVETDEAFDVLLQKVHITLAEGGGPASPTTIADSATSDDLRQSRSQRYLMHLGVRT